MKKININPYQKKSEKLLLTVFVIVLCLTIALVMILFVIRKEYNSQQQLWTANIELYNKFEDKNHNAEKKEILISQMDLKDLDQLMSIRSNSVNIDRLRYSLEGYLEIEGSCPELMDLTNFIDAAQAIEIDIQIKRVAKADGGGITFELERK